MPWTKRAATIVGSLALVSGLAGVRPAQAAGDAGETRPPDLEAASQAFDAALKKDDVEALFSHMADDVLLMPPGETPVRGKAAAHEWYVGLLSQYRTSSLVFTQREVFEGQALGVVMGAHEWVLKPSAGGDPVIDRGSYMQVWAKQPDGRWLFAREIWNASSPPATP